MRSLVLALVLVSGCSSIGLGFDMSYDVPNLSVPGDPHADAVAPFAVDVDIGQQQSHADEVSTVTLASIEFSITDQSGCFDFVDDVSLTISSTKPGTTLAPAVVATASGPGCVHTFSLTPTAVDLKPYLAEGAIVSATGSGVPPASAVTFDGHIVLHASL